MGASKRKGTCSKISSRSRSPGRHPEHVPVPDVPVSGDGAYFADVNATDHALRQLEYRSFLLFHVLMLWHVRANCVVMRLRGTIRKNPFDG